MPDEAFNSWGWRIPFLLSFVVIIAGYIIRREVDETPAFAEEGEHGEVPKAPIIEAFKTSWPDMLRVVCMALMNVIPVVADDLRRGLRGAAGLRHRLPQGRLPVDSGPGQHPGGDRHPLSSATCRTRSAAGRRSSSARSRSGLLSFGYLYAISIHSVPLAIVMSLLMWGVVYQGYNAIFPSFYPELFPTRTRVSAMAISQNVGTTITALLPALFAAVAPPGSTNIPLTIGALTFGITIIAAVAALSARETYRIHLNDLGKRDAVPVPKAGIRPAAGAEPFAAAH